ncbi:MAG: hypothetical protein FWB80_01285 [Defluviitaleaceae bacterium]|nr:hypothetical protein [Defluviitaleaceae bacterium]
MECNFENIEQFINLLKQNNEVIGILEYGGRSYKDMTAGGDYDMTVITRTCTSKDISGLHFHIAGIPIDCMVKSVDDFMLEEPASEFELAHLNCKILFERDNIASDLLERIKYAWKPKTELTERDICWFRFTYKHVIDKLEHRLHDDILYSNYFMSASLDWFLACYAKIKKLEIGKPKTYLNYMKDNESELYAYFVDFFNTVDVDERFRLIKLCAEYMTRDIGGLWKEDEILLHLIKDSVSAYEKDAFLNCIFRTK